jgi:hypothetical protein
MTQRNIPEDVILHSSSGCWSSQTWRGGASKEGITIIFQNIAVAVAVAVAVAPAQKCAVLTDNTIAFLVSIITLQLKPYKRKDLEIN